MTLLRYVVSEDFGPMINPNVVEGQIAGGAVQGIGGVLLEHIVYDDDGNPLATTFMDYLLPTTPEVPDHRVRHVETPAPGPGGHKGVGEGGAIGAAAGRRQRGGRRAGALRGQAHPAPAEAVEMVAMIAEAQGAN